MWLVKIIYFIYFRCLGSTQHLKNMYGSRYVLVVKCVLEDEDWKVVEDEIYEIFDEIIRFYSW